jgi:hypothetical protein
MHLYTINLPSDLIILSRYQHLLLAALFTRTHSIPKLRHFCEDNERTHESSIGTQFSSLYTQLLYLHTIFFSVHTVALPTHHFLLCTRFPYLYTIFSSVHTIFFSVHTSTYSNFYHNILQQFLPILLPGSSSRNNIHSKFTPITPWFYLTLLNVMFSSFTLC